MLHIIRVLGLHELRVVEEEEIEKGAKFCTHTITKDPATSKLHTAIGINFNQDGIASTFVITKQFQKAFDITKETHI